MKKSVLACVAPPPFVSALARKAPDITLQPLEAARLAEIDPQAAALFVSPSQGFGPSAPQGWPFNLSYVQLASVGVDGYPSWLLNPLPVSTTRGVSSVALAEYVLAAIFTAAKRIPDLFIDKAEDWRYRPLAMVEGTTLGMIGFGGVGEALAPRALALGMKVIATRRSDAPLSVQGAERATLDEVVERSDHLVIAAPATADTRHLVNAQLLAKAKPGQHLINIARGSLIDQDALIAALDAGPLGLATLDVAEPEPLPAGHPLYSHKKVRLSPHTSVITPDMIERLIDYVIANVRRHAAGEAPVNLFDAGLGY